MLADPSFEQGYMRKLIQQLGVGRRLFGQPASVVGRWKKLSGRRLMSSSASGTSSGQPPQQSEGEDKARQKAMKILDWFPGDTLAKKSAYLTIGGGLASYLVVNDIYIANEETLILVTFAVFVRYMHKLLSKPVTELLDKDIEEVCYKWEMSKERDKKSLRESIAELESFRDFEDVAREFMATKKENVQLEVELEAQKQVNAEYAQIKALLDERYRFELEKRDLEKRQLVSSIIEGVIADLKDPKMQDSILAQCLLDMEALPAAK